MSSHLSAIHLRETDSPFGVPLSEQMMSSPLMLTQTHVNDGIKPPRPHAIHRVCYHRVLPDCCDSARVGYDNGGGFGLCFFEPGACSLMGGAVLSETP